MQNPLLDLIQTFIEARGSKISVYEIIKGLSLARYPIWSDNADLKLYQQNFLVMNALYQLQAEYLKKGLFLAINPLDIHFEPLSTTGSSTALSQQTALASYYLDWKNYQQTTAKDVKELLDSFWNSFTKQDDLYQAYQTLGLKTNSSASQIKAQYLLLAKKFHPDKGGCADQFIQIQKAYQILKKTLKKPPAI